MFFRGPWSEHRFQKGNLKYVILGLIRDKPRYGYEIIRALEERSHGFYTPSPGTVYPTLQMLEEMGYINYEQKDGKKVYSITDEGRHFLEQQGDFAEEIQNQMKHWWNPPDMKEMSQTMREFVRLGHLVRRQAHNVGADKMQRIREVISSTHEEIERIIME
jgi:DNA-binding PadR family transcriptional regulator